MAVASYPATLIAAETTYYRPLRPSDINTLKAVHSNDRPVSSGDGFLLGLGGSPHRVSFPSPSCLLSTNRTHAQSCSGPISFGHTCGSHWVFSWAAVQQDGCGGEVMMGFVTARLVYLHECETGDRQLLGLQGAHLDHEMAVYVLTLGVLPAYQQRGIASALLQLVHQQAIQIRCCAIFLHVISYNDRAIKLYNRLCYHCAGKLTKFYFINTGRQPNPNQTTFDAYLYVLFTSTGLRPVTWPWAAFHSVMSPLRYAWDKLHCCLPAYHGYIQCHGSSGPHGWLHPSEGPTEGGAYVGALSVPPLPQPKFTPLNVNCSVNHNSGWDALETYPQDRVRAGSVQPGGAGTSLLHRLFDPRIQHHRHRKEFKD